MDRYSVTLVIYLAGYRNVQRTATFTVSIHICTQKVVISKMTYRIGNPTQKGGNYEYFIDDSCKNYAQTIALTGLPGFVTHNEESQDFTIDYTEDVTLAGIYEVTISSVILIPDFPVQTTFTAVTHNYDFIIDVQDPCVLTFLDLVTVHPMHRFVG